MGQPLRGPADDRRRAVARADLDESGSSKSGIRHKKSPEPTSRADANCGDGAAEAFAVLGQSSLIGLRPRENLTFNRLATIIAPSS
jgi:hypothetical protein